MQHLPKRPSTKGPAERFTGDVYIDPAATGDVPEEVNAGLVHFTPGARSAWHAHAGGQTLYVIEGVGLVQARGEAVVELRPGDTVVAPAGEEHWHGAAPDHLMTHLSVTRAVPGQTDAWGDHVTDEEYGGPRA